MKGKIRVLQILSSLSFGGVQSFVMNYYSYIDKDRFCFDFLIESKDITERYKKEIEKYGGKIIIAPELQKQPAKHIYTVAKTLESGHYDAVHCNMNYLNIVYILIAELLGVRIRISHSHNNYETTNFKNFLRKIEQPLLRHHSTYLFACSAAAGEWLYGRRGKNKTIVVKNAIDISAYLLDSKTREIVRTRYGLMDKFVIGHVGSFIEQKNHEFIVAVFREIAKIVTNSVLLLVGSGQEEHRIRGIINEIGMEEKVIFLGQRSDVNELLMAMDVFLFPSRFEGLPLALIEAQCSGLKCFISDELWVDEAIMTDNIVKISLERSPQEWASVICQHQGERSGCRLNEKSVSYDIRSQVRILESYYGQ